MSNHKEAPIQRDIMRAINSCHYALCMDTSHVGLYRDRFGNPVTIGGTKGQPDLIVFVAEEGVPVAYAVEVKAPGGRQSRVQKAWERSWRQRFPKGEYVIVHSVEEAMEALDLDIHWNSIKERFTK